MNKIFLDFETRSAVDIKKVGAWAYARHPSTEIICLAVGERGKRTQILTPPMLTPHPSTLNEGDTLVAHNAHFEYAIYNFILHERYGWPAVLDPKRWSCTLSRAAMCNLPLSLEHAGAALGIKSPKDLHGRAALMKICKPTDFDPLGEPIYNEDPELYAKVYTYCQRDVVAEMELDARLPELPPGERAIWELDLLINSRGVAVDLPLAQAASALAGELTDELNAHLWFLTKGAVSKASRVAEMKRYLTAQGLKGIESLDKNAVNVLLADPTVPQKLKDVLSIRRQVGKSSTAKYAAVINSADPRGDGRVRGVLQYHAAGTGRWGGRLIQPQNFPKGLPPKAQLNAVAAIKDAQGGVFSLIYGDEAMETLSGALRGVIVAPPGKRLLVADYSAIEARVVLWLADESKALDAYRKGVNLYVDLARFIYNNPKIEKATHPREYALAKSALLGAGYGMGKDKFQATCQLQGVDISIDLAYKAIRAYRDKYNQVVQMWYATESAARNAVKNPGCVYKACGGRVLFGMDQKREFLVAKLPSGRHLRYYRPSIRTIETPVGEKETIFYWCAGLNGALEEYKTYGGSLVENLTQAIARDIMANGMIQCDAEGYPIVLTVHDELVAEREIGEGSIEEFIKIMCDTPKWAAGCPITAEGWEGGRYHK